MNKTTGVLIFAAGVAVGVAAMWNYAKKQERIADDEIASMREFYEKKELAQKTPVEEKVEKWYGHDNDQPDISAYASLLHNSGYTSEPEEEMKKNLSDRPYIIPPDDFGELPDYSKISLTYYIDGYLCDENDELVDDVEATIGYESLNHFGEYEDDSVFVRNDARKCDYEVLLSQRSYREIAKTLPRSSRGGGVS